MAVVLPAIQHVIGKGRVRLVESITDNEVANDLDMHAGIDLYTLHESGGLVGVASRVQYNRAYPTMTVRETTAGGGMTEYEKRRRAIRSQGEIIYPYWTCHAYVNELAAGGYALRLAAVAKTADLIAAIDPSKTEKRRAPGGNTFFVVPFRDIPNCYVIDPRDNQYPLYQDPPLTISAPYGG